MRCTALENERRIATGDVELAEPLPTRGRVLPAGSYVTLEVEEEAPNRIQFRDLLGEDFRHYSGSWELMSDSSRTIVAYALDARPRASVPHLIGRSMMSHGANDLLSQVRTEMERRARTR